MCSGELRSNLMLRLREGRCGEVEEQDWEGKEHPPLDILETTRGKTKKMSEFEHHHFCNYYIYYYIFIYAWLNFFWLYCLIYLYITITYYFLLFSFFVVPSSEATYMVSLGCWLSSFWAMYIKCDGCLSCCAWWWSHWSKRCTAGVNKKKKSSADSTFCHDSIFYPHGGTVLHINVLTLGLHEAHGAPEVIVLAASGSLLLVVD